MDFDPVRFNTYVEQVRARLAVGEQEYRDNPAARKKAVALVEEIREELRDVTAWAFLLDEKLVSILEKMERASESVDPTSTETGRQLLLDFGRGTPE